MTEEFYKDIVELNDAWNNALMFGDNIKLLGPNPSWYGSKFAYIMVDGKEETAKVLGDKAWVLDGYEPTGELYSNWTFVRFLRGMDI